MAEQSQAQAPAFNTGRERLLGAAVELSYRTGYEAYSATDLIAASRVARSAFYAFFQSKRECVEAAYEAAFEGLVARVDAARQPASDWRDDVAFTLAALRHDIAGSPRLAHLVIVVGSALRLETPELDPAPRLLAALSAARESANGAAVDGSHANGTHSDGVEAAASQPAAARAVAVARAAVWDLLVEAAHASREDRPSAPLEELAYAALCPFVGASDAGDQAAWVAGRAEAVQIAERAWTLFDSGVGDPPRPTVERLKELRSSGELRHQDFARALGVSTRTIARWLSGAGEPSPSVTARTADSVQALEAVVKAMPGLAGREWLVTDNRVLDGQAPVDALGYGQHARVRLAFEHLNGNGGGDENGAAAAPAEPQPQPHSHRPQRRNGRRITSAPRQRYV